MGERACCEREGKQSLVIWWWYCERHGQHITTVWRGTMGAPDQQEDIEHVGPFESPKEIAGYLGRRLENFGQELRGQVSLF